MRSYDMKYYRRKGKDCSIVKDWLCLFDKG